MATYEYWGAVFLGGEGRGGDTIGVGGVSNQR